MRTFDVIILVGCLLLLLPVIIMLFTQVIKSIILVKAYVKEYNTLYETQSINRKECLHDLNNLNERLHAMKEELNRTGNTSDIIKESSKILKDFESLVEKHEKI